MCRLEWSTVVGDHNDVLAKKTVPVPDMLLTSRYRRRFYRLLQRAEILINRLILFPISIVTLTLLFYLCP